MIGCIKKKEKILCNTLTWGNWNSGFVKLVGWWAEQDVCIRRCMKPEGKVVKTFTVKSGDDVLLQSVTGSPQFHHKLLLLWH